MVKKNLIVYVFTLSAVKVFILPQKLLSTISTLLKGFLFLLFNFTDPCKIYGFIAHFSQVSMFTRI